MMNTLKCFTSSSRISDSSLLGMRLIVKSFDVSDTTFLVTAPCVSRRPTSFANPE